MKLFSLCFVDCCFLFEHFYGIDWMVEFFRNYLNKFKILYTGNLKTNFTYPKNLVWFHFLELMGRIEIKYIFWGKVNGIIWQIGTKNPPNRQTESSPLFHNLNHDSSKFWNHPCHKIITKVLIIINATYLTDLHDFFCDSLYRFCLIKH